jgi:hypothetical protein
LLPASHNFPPIHAALNSLLLFFGFFFVHAETKKNEMKFSCKKEEIKQLIKGARCLNKRERNLQHITTICIIAWMRRTQRLRCADERWWLVCKITTNSNLVYEFFPLHVDHHLIIVHWWTHVILPIWDCTSTN